MRYRMDLAYRGEGFFGWQTQVGVPTVQGELERALSLLLKEEIRVVGAGRTDTGVNASAYVAHFDSAGVRDCRQLAFKLNAILPDAIAVFSVCEVPGDFHARFDAVSREYTYYLHRVKDPFLASSSYYYGYPRVDFDAMNRCARALTGTHDFSCFEKTGGDNKTSICSVSEALWLPYAPAFRKDAPEGSFWFFRICADRFLRNMVRAIVGTLLEVGRGKRTEAEFTSLVLEATEASLRTGESRRSCAGESVPGHALFLSRILYGADAGRV